MASARPCMRSRSTLTMASPGRGPRLTEGMVLAIEPMVNAGKPAVKVLADGWTAVHAETAACPRISSIPSSP